MDKNQEPAKILHYCWFGPKPLSKLAKKCMISWKKFLPDYEIKFWNEEYYILTDNYIIIKNKKITHFEYNKIKKIKKTKKYHHRGGYDIYLNITLQNKEEYKILIYTTSLVNEEYKDISGFILEKIDKL